MMNPKHPVYIISKGRWESRLTSKSLEQRGIPYRIVVEPQEHAQYAAVIDPSKILTLPFSNLGQGSVPARNWVWGHAIAAGAARHWILDDNIRHFYMMTKGKKWATTSGSGFAALESWADRYENVGLVGMGYALLTPVNRTHYKPIRLNTRIYSCILINNALPFRWRGRYNEDTDLSLRVLKAGWCTALSDMFLCGKQATLTMKGGNTDELYRQNATVDGRLAMARSLERQHPDVTKVVWKWGRWQHSVDYRPFKGNRLRLRPGVVIPEGVDNFGMVLVDKTKDAQP
jgi:hypothetical protein